MPSPTSSVKTIIHAGAGTGKTTTLTQSVLDFAEAFYAKNKKWPYVLISTFTRKATQELKQRLASEVFKNNKNHLIDFVSGGSYLTVTTLHGCFSIFLRRYGQAFDLDPSFELADSYFLTPLKKKCFLKALKSFSKRQPDFLPALDNYSVKELTKIVLLLDDLATTQKQIHSWTAQELVTASLNFQKEFYSKGLEIIHIILSSCESSKSGENWRSYMQKIEVGFKNHESDFTLLLSSIQSAGRKPPFRADKAPFDANIYADWVAWVKTLKDKVDSGVLELQRLQEHARVHQALELLQKEFSAIYIHEKKNKNKLEIKDLETITLSAIESQPQWAELFAQEWDSIFIDEYQDTSPLQVQILNLLFHQRPEFFVGDPQQSIYLFRGARSEVFNLKVDEIGKIKNGEVRYLTQNYRSTREYIHFLNSQIEKLGPSFTRLESHPKSPQTVGPVLFLDRREKDDVSPYEGMARYIQSQVQAGATYGDFAVLVRSNDEVDQISDFLSSQNIPQQKHSVGGFFQQQEVQDALSLLRFLCFSSDYKNLIHLLRTPYFRVDDEQLYFLKKKTESLAWVEIFNEYKHLKPLQDLNFLLKQADEKGVYFAWLSALQEHGFISQAAHYDSSRRTESNIYKLVHRLRLQMREPGFHYGQFLEWARLETHHYNEEDLAPAVLEPHRVQVMTIHQSKGLKFNQVLLPNAHKRPSVDRVKKSLVVFDEIHKKWSTAFAYNPEKNSHPVAAESWLEHFKNLEMQENKRLYYVAITRAVEKCYIHWIGDPAEEAWANYLPTLTEPGRFRYAHGSESFEYEVLDHSNYLIEKPISLKPLNIHKGESIVDPYPPLDQEQRSSSALSTLKRMSVTAWLNQNYKGASSQEDLQKQESFEYTANDVLVEKSLHKIMQSISRPLMGTLIHSALENLKYDWDFEAKKLRLNEKYLDEKDWPLFEQALNYVKNLEYPPLKEVLSSGFTEWGFQMKMNSIIVEGQIDLWGVVDKDLWVIDYKTGSSLFSEKAKKQVQLYGEALQKLYPKFRIRHALIYTYERKTEVF